jgi:anti-sigma factor RsiW
MKHLTDQELIGWLDESEAPHTPNTIPTHLETCDLCAGRLAELERVFVALRSEPDTPSADEFSAQRERIVDAIAPETRRSTVRSLQRGGWWIPVAAAAVVIGVFVLTPDEPVDAPAQLAIIDQADRAAEDALNALEGETEVEAMLAALDNGFETRAYDIVPLEEEFASLAEEDQAAILSELSTTSFDL